MFVIKKHHQLRIIIDNKKKYIIVYIYKNIFLKQAFLENDKNYTLLYVYHTLSKFGLIEVN